MVIEVDSESNVALGEEVVVAAELLPRYGGRSLKCITWGTFGQLVRVGWFRETRERKKETELALENIGKNFLSILLQSVNLIGLTLF